MDSGIIKKRQSEIYKLFPHYSAVNGLERENLRDHMTDIELILTMLGEATTTKLHRDRDSQGFDPLKKVHRTAAQWLAEHARILKHRPANR
ncbi:MAG: hypothetical protein K8R25_12675 [Methanosarcinales archaeon]|nr:hypothetical protein [Methanosarcinales archaeon]